MKRLIALILTLTLALGLAACNSSDGGGAMDKANSGDSVVVGDQGNDLPTVSWKMGSTWGNGTYFYSRDVLFAETVSELTNGKFTINVYGEGELCSSAQCLDYVSDGTIQAAGDCPGYWGGRNTAFEPLCFTCNDFTAMDYLTWINRFDGLEVYNKIYGQFNIVYFPHTITWTESGMRTSSPVTSLEDMKSMKLRVGGVVASRMLKSLGVNIVSMAGGELYEAIMRGTIDGCEFANPSSDISLGLDEVAPYLLLPCWYQSANVNGVMINQEAYNALPDAYKDALKRATEITRSQIDATFYDDTTAFRTMMDAGRQNVTFLSEEDMALVQDAIDTTYAEVEQENPDFKMVRDSMRAYREYVDVYRDALDIYGFGISGESK